MSKVFCVQKENWSLTLQVANKTQNYFLKSSDNLMWNFIESCRSGPTASSLNPLTHRRLSKSLRAHAEVTAVWRGSRSVSKPVHSLFSQGKGEGEVLAEAQPPETNGLITGREKKDGRTQQWCSYKWRRRCCTSVRRHTGVPHLHSVVSDGDLPLCPAPGEQKQMGGKAFSDQVWISFM